MTSFRPDDDNQRLQAGRPSGRSSNPTGQRPLTRPEQRVAIVVDSAASLPSYCDQLFGPHVVPVQLSIDGKSYLDGQDLTTGDFYRLLRRSKRPLSTASPAPGSFLSAFESAAAEARSILCLTISSHFSSTYDSAMVAAAQAAERTPGLRIEVVDTESAAGGQGLVVTEALRAARNGLGLDEVAAACTKVIPRVSLLGCLDTLYYVWKSGRVPGIAHVSTKLLKIKPLLELTRGSVKSIGRPRTTQRAVARLLWMMRQRAGSGQVHAAVMHADAAEEAEMIRRRIESDFETVELFVSEFSPALGAHTGPGLLGVAFWAEDTPPGIGRAAK